MTANEIPLEEQIAQNTLAFWEKEYKLYKSLGDKKMANWCNGVIAGLKLAFKIGGAES